MPIFTKTPQTGDTGKYPSAVQFTFEPDKFDGADEFAAVRFQANCVGDLGCYRRIEGFRRGTW